MLTPVIVNTIDVRHIRYIYKTTVSLIKTSFIKPFLHRLTPLSLEGEAEIHRCFSDHLFDVPVNFLILSLSFLNLTHSISSKRSKTLFGYKLITMRTNLLYNRMFINHFIIRNKECLQDSWVRRKGKFKKSTKFPDTFIITCILDLTLIIQTKTSNTIIRHNIYTTLVFI